MRVHARVCMRVQMCVRVHVSACVYACMYVLENRMSIFSCAYQSCDVFLGETLGQSSCLLSLLPSDESSSHSGHFLTLTRACTLTFCWELSEGARLHNGSCRWLSGAQAGMGWLGKHQEVTLVLPHRSRNGLWLLQCSLQQKM